MNRHWAMGIFVVGMLIGWAALPAVADLTVKVEISGSMEEIIPVLQLLQQNGIGVGTGAAAPAEGGLKVDLQSTTQAPEEPIPAPADPAAVQAPVPAPTLAIQDAKVSPETVKPGEKALVTVTLIDVDKRVDTVGARNAADDQYLFDLYDDGTNGDAVAGDGVWSFEYTVPTDLQDQALAIAIRGYDKNAAPVLVETPPAEGGSQAPQVAPLATNVTLNVKR